MLRLPAALAALLIALLACAQELTVTDFRPTINPMTVDMQRRDANNSICAIVKVELPVAGATFSGNVVGDTPLRTSEYWVYMTPGTKMLQVKCPGHYPLMVDFRQLGCDALREKTIYTLRLKPDASVAANGSVAADPGANYLVLDITPKTGAQVKIDNQLQTVKNGSVRAYLKYGKHTYSVEADGYVPVTGTAEITAQGKVVRTIVLESAMSQLTVTGQTPGCRIFVNDEEKGTGSWTGSLPAGFYKVELRKEGYKPAIETVELAQSDNKTLTVPPLRQLFGILNVDCDPVGATISIDCKNVGTTPDRFTGIPVGEHEVMIAKTGYTPLVEKVKVSDGAESRITGSLKLASYESAGASTSATVIANGNNLTFNVNGVPLEMIFVEGGETSIRGGWVNGKYRKLEALLSDYFLGKYEVTNELWNAVMGLKPAAEQDSKLPVTGKTYDEIISFIRRLNKITGQDFILPSHAQWDYAAQGGKLSKGYKYAGSDSISEVAWYKHNKMDSLMLHSVGCLKPNELGFYDMTGNAGEMIVFSSPHSYTERVRYCDPIFVERIYVDKYLNHVLGGSVMNLPHELCLEKTKNYIEYNKSDHFIGFRLALPDKTAKLRIKPDFIPQNKVLEFDVNGYKLKMAVVDGNGFNFCMNIYEVTRELRSAVLGDYIYPESERPYSFGVDNKNVVNKFLKKLNKITGKNFRLPTSEEWKYAARGGKYSQGYKFPGSDNLDDVASYNGNSNYYTPVGQHKPNELGLYDMSGLCYEITVDDKGKKYFLQGGSVGCGLYDIEELKGNKSIDVTDKKDFEDKSFKGIRLVLDL